MQLLSQVVKKNNGCMAVGLDTYEGMQKGYINAYQEDQRKEVLEYDTA